MSVNALFSRLSLSLYFLSLYNSKEAPISNFNTLVRSEVLKKHK